MSDPLASVRKHIADMPAIIVVGDHTWYTMPPEVIAAAFVTKIRALEQQKLNLVIELTEALDVVDQPRAYPDPEHTPGRATQVDLRAHMAELERGISEYDLRIGALLKAVEAAGL